MKFEECVIQKWATGSRYICNPAPTDTDNDTVFLVNGFYPWDDMLKSEGFKPCGNYTGEEFESYRKGEENYIITEDPDFFLSYVKATEAAKALNLLEKEDRIKLFHTIDNFRLKNGKVVDFKNPFNTTNMINLDFEVVENRILAWQNNMNQVLMPQEIPLNAVEWGVNEVIR